MKTFLGKIAGIFRNSLCTDRRIGAFEVVVAILALGILSSVTYHKLFLYTGIVARKDMVFAFGMQPFYRALTRSFYPWDSHLFMGYYEPMFSSTLFFKLSIAPLMMVFPVTDAAVVWLILTLLFSGVSMYYMVYRLSGKKKAGFVSAVLYMYNPWILERILSGHLTILIGYAIMPIFMVLFMESSNTLNRLQAIQTGLVFALLMFIEMRVAWLAFILMAFYFIFHLLWNVIKKQKLHDRLFLVKEEVLCLFIVVGLGFLLNAFWIVPYLNYLSTYGSTYPASLPTIQYMYGYGSKATIPNVARMSGYWIAHFEKIVLGSLNENTELISLWFVLGFSLAAFAFISSLLQRGDRKYSAFFALTALAGIFLGKGANEPFGFLYVWAFEHAFAGLFHEPNRFVFFVSFSYAFLIGSGTSSLSDILKEKPFETNRKLPAVGKIGKRLISALPAVVICLLILSYSWPMITGDFYGELSRVEYPEEYKDLDSWLAGQSGDYRVLFLPPWYFTKYDWLPERYDNIREHLIVYPAKPVVALGYGDLSDRFTRFVLWSFYHNRTEYAGKLLSLLGVRYIILRTDAIDLIPTEFNTTDLRLNVLPYLQGIREVWRRDRIIIYENIFYSPHFFASKNTTAVAGDSRILNSLSFVESFYPEFYPMLFLAQNDRDNSDFILSNSELIMVQDSKVPDIVFSLLEGTHFIKPWFYAEPTNNFQGTWATSSLLYSEARFEGPLAETDSWVTTNASGARLDMPLTVASDGQYDIWMKLFFGSSINSQFNIKNNLTLMIDETELVRNIGESVGDRLNFGFAWLKVASSFIRSGREHTVSIMSGDGMSIVSRMAVIPQGTFDKLYEHLLDIVEQNKHSMLYLLEAENSFKTTNPWKITKEKGVYSSNSLSLLYDEERSSTNQSLEERSAINGTFDVVRPSMYMIALRVANDDHVDLTLSVDATNYNLSIPNNPKFGYYHVGPIYLDIGRHWISISGNQRLFFDQVSVFTVNTNTYMTLDEFLIVNNYANLDSNEVNPSKYEIDTGQTSGSALLVFLESYDASWKAFYNNEQISSFLVYSYANCFFLENVASSKIVVVEYTRYNYELMGLVVSASSAVMIATLFLISKRGRVKELLNKTMRSLPNFHIN
jgi:hypothetical protein